MNVIVAWIFLYLVMSTVWVFVNSYPYEISYGIKNTAWQQVAVLFTLALVYGIIWSINTLLTQG